MKKLKPKEQKVFDYIVKAVNDNGFAPTVRDIMADLGYKSTSTVHMYLNRLDTLGYIRKEDGKSRAISIASDGKPPVTAVPVLGTVTAGQPILAQENFEGYIGFIGSGSEEMFALSVKGDSMIEIGILDGDTIIAEKTCYAENGEIVVALIENEATVKRFFRENGHYRLQPENSTMEPIIVDEVLILGKVVAIQRRY